MRYVPANPMLDRNAHIHGDEDYHEFTCGDITLIEREAQRLCTAKLVSADWWHARLGEDGTPIAAELPFLLSNLASKALAAETAKGRGVEILDAGIAIAVTRFVLRQGREAAMAQARVEAEERLEQGDLQ